MPTAAAKLFTPPLRIVGSYVWDAAGHMVASRGPSDEFYGPRGWGRIQHLPDGDSLMSAWEREYAEIVGEQTTAEAVIAALRPALEAHAA